MKLAELYSFRVNKEIVTNKLRALNEELEKAGAKYRYGWHTAYGKPHLKVCRAEHFDKETLYCSVVSDDIPFSTRQDLLNAVRALRYATER